MTLLEFIVSKNLFASSEGLCLKWMNQGVLTFVLWKGRRHGGRALVLVSLTNYVYSQIRFLYLR